MSLDRRTVTYRELVNLMPTTDELLSEEIDGRVYLYKREPRCRVCMAPEDLRQNIDTLLLFPKTYRETLSMSWSLQEHYRDKFIEKFIDDKGPQDTVPVGEELQSLKDKALQIWEKKRKITYSSIRVHQKRHLPFDKLAIREIVERRALEQGKSILNGTGRLLTSEAFYETIAQKAFTRLVEGEAVPSLLEGMRAVQLLHNLEREADASLSMTEVLAELNMILGAVREVCSDEQMEKIVTRIDQLKNSELAYVEDEDILDAELVMDEEGDEEWSLP